MNKQRRSYTRACCLRFYSALILWIFLCISLPWAISLHIIA